jgi:hypothetical protein
MIYKVYNKIKNRLHIWTFKTPIMTFKLVKIWVVPSMGLVCIHF